MCEAKYTLIHIKSTKTLNRTYMCTNVWVYKLVYECMNRERERERERERAKEGSSRIINSNGTFADTNPGINKDQIV